MTKLPAASLQQFSSVWNEIMLLLSIKVENKEDVIAEHKALLKALTAYMKTEYPHLTTGDLILAYRLGVKYKLGIEMYAELNARQIGKVLNAYEQYKHEEYAKFYPATPPKSVAALPEYKPSQQEIDRGVAELFRLAFQAQQQGRDYDDMGNHIYNWLDSKELIPFSPEVKWEFMKKAQNLIRSEEAGRGSTGNMQEHKNARNLAGLLKQAAEQNQVYLPLKDRIKTKAKQLAFIQLLKDMIEFDQTPDDFLTTITDEENQTKED